MSERYNFWRHDTHACRPKSKIDLPHKARNQLGKCRGCGKSTKLPIHQRCGELAAAKR